MSQIGEMANCKITVKGSFCEVGKKPPPGHRKLLLYLECNSRHDLSSAAKEIKRNLEEIAMSSTRNSAGINAYGEFSGTFAKTV